MYLNTYIDPTPLHSDILIHLNELLLQKNFLKIYCTSCYSYCKKLIDCRITDLEKGKQLVLFSDRRLCQKCVGGQK